MTPERARAAGFFVSGFADAAVARTCFAAFTLLLSRCGRGTNVYRIERKGRSVIAGARACAIIPANSLTAAYSRGRYDEAPGVACVRELRSDRSAELLLLPPDELWPAPL